MRFLPIFALIAVIGCGVWLEIRLVHLQPAREAIPAPSDTPAPRKSVSETDKVEARNQARLLTLNARLAASHPDGAETPLSIQFPSFEQVVQDQIKSGILRETVGQNILAENAGRDPFIRLRVGYICQPKHGHPFPIITNNEIDQHLGKMDDPATMTQQILGLTNSDPWTAGN